MNKLKEIERLEKSMQRLMLIFYMFSLLPVVVTLALIPLGIINFTAPLSLLLLIVMAVFFLRKLIKNIKRSEQLRREWLEEREFAEVKPKVAERPFVEESENDELWKLIDSNSPTDED